MSPLGNTEQPQSAAPSDGPDVSVVVPSYNRLDILPRCLEALARQTHPSFEVIVVDDGSTDGTGEFLRSVGEQHPDLHFRWLTNDQNVGATASRNRGIREARGRFVACLDSDCIADPHWLEHLIGGFDSEQVAAVNGLIRDPLPANIYELAMKGTSRVHGRQQARRLVACNLALRRDLALRYPFDEGTRIYAEEEALQLRLQADGYLLGLASDAVVLHEHRYDRKSYFRRARLGGAAAAWLVYKFHRPPRMDLLPFLFAYLTLPLGLVRAWLLLVPVLFFILAVAALAFNEMSRKGKSAGRTLQVLPLQLAFYHVRLWAYVLQCLRLYLLPNDVERVRLRRQAQPPEAWQADIR
jgi:glycosyltransferase involved in cell wall biosynthesis